MQFEQTQYRDTTEQMVLPLFQPLRYWNPRHAVQKKPAIAKNTNNMLPAQQGRVFTMKGGFVNVANGERRLVIAGRIFKAGDI